MSSTATILASSKRALQYVSEYDYWFVLGKTSPWDNDSLPPHPSSSLLQLPEAAFFVYAHNNRIVYPKRNGPIRSNIGNFSYYDSTNLTKLASLNASYVYTEAKINPNQLPDGFSYRALGIAANVLFRTQVERNVGSIVHKSKVISYDLEWISFFKPIEPLFSNEHTIRIVRRF